MQRLTCHSCIHTLDMSQVTCYWKILENAKCFPTHLYWVTLQRSLALTILLAECLVISQWWHASPPRHWNILSLGLQQPFLTNLEISSSLCKMFDTAAWCWIQPTSHFQCFLTPQIKAVEPTLPHHLVSIGYLNLPWFRSLSWWCTLLRIQPSSGPWWPWQSSCSGTPAVTWLSTCGNRGRLQSWGQCAGWQNRPRLQTGCSSSASR